MDLIYTDAKGNESGVLHRFSLDFDTTDKKDFEITVGRDTSQFMQGESRWYIEDTEYGGIVDNIEINTDTQELKYTGRNYRAVLQNKVISPPEGRDHKTVSGNITNITNSLLLEHGLNDLYSCEPQNIDSPVFSFDRYCTLYDGLVKLAYSLKKVIALNCKRDGIHISYIDRIDYSDEMEYTQDSIGFRAKKGYNNVNHLICLGQGELQNRQVVHLYVDGDGDIVEKQYYFGLDEIAQTYENVNAEDIDTLKQEGIDKLGEIKNSDELEVTSVEVDGLKIGDVVGGYDLRTDIRIKREIVNVIAKLTDTTITLNYEVGGTNPGDAAIASDVVEEYILPVATESRLGGIKISNQFSILNSTLTSPSFEVLKNEYKNAIFICS